MDSKLVSEAETKIGQELVARLEKLGRKEMNHWTLWGLRRAFNDENAVEIVLVPHPRGGFFEKEETSSMRLIWRPGVTSPGLVGGGIEGGLATDVKTMGLLSEALAEVCVVGEIAQAVLDERAAKGE